MWLYKNQPVQDLIEGFESFVYLIERTNLIEDSTSPIFYIGKKTFYSKRKIRKKITVIESDWQQYYGSSEQLKEDVQRYGTHCFERHILYFCKTRGDSGYLEVKEQINRNVLYMDDDGYKLYYNKNILGRYFKHPENYIIDEDIKLYFSSRSIEGNNKNKKWVNNGNINKLLTKKDAEKIIGTNGWIYGKIKPRIPVNNGIENHYIDDISYLADYTLGHISKRYTNGVNNKLILLHEIEEFLKNNDGWYLGFSGNIGMIWITNGNNDIKIKASDIDNYKGYVPGRNNIPTRGKIAVFKEKVHKYIYDDELKEAEIDGWCKGSSYKGHKLYFVTDDIDQKSFKSEEERTNFLKDNSYWRSGQFIRKNFNTTDKVFAIDMELNQKVCVSKEEFKNNNILTGIKTKKIKVKKKNKIIFEGYTTLFFNTFDVPKNQFMKALRGDGVVKIIKGKNKYLTEEQYTIVYI